MSANVYFRPLPDKTYPLDVPGPSQFKKLMQEIWLGLGDPPWRFSREYLPSLRGAAAVYDCEPNPFQNLIEAIEKYGEIEVWYEY